MVVAGDFIYTDSGDFCQFCSLNIQRTLKKCLSTFLLLLISFFAISFGPFYVFIKYGQYTTLTSLKMPYVDAFSGLEFICNNVLQMSMFIMGYPENLGIEGIFALLMDSTTLSTEYIKWHCSKFSRGLSRNQYSPRQQKMMMVTILKQIQATDGYVYFHSSVN